MRGHKDTVLSVHFSFDGTRFASGGADKVVVIWKSSGQGLLKYNHTSPVQRVRFNPTLMLLASCAEVIIIYLFLILMLYLIKIYMKNILNK